VVVPVGCGAPAEGVADGNVGVEAGVCGAWVVAGVFTGALVGDGVDGAFVDPGVAIGGIDTQPATVTVTRTIAPSRVSTAAS